MSTAKLIPAEPEVIETRTVVVREAEPAKIVLELSILEAELVRALLGPTTGGLGYDVFKGLRLALESAGVSAATRKKNDHTVAAHFVPTFDTDEIKL